MKGVIDIGGLRDIRSLRNIARRSFPKVRSSTYLELYVLWRERDRLEKEAALLAKRNHVIQKRLREIHTDMEGLERSAQSESPNTGVRKAEPSDPTRRKWKTLAVRY